MEWVDLDICNFPMVVADCIVSHHGSTPEESEMGRGFPVSVVSAVTTDGLTFEFEPGYRLCDRETHYDSAGITAAEVVPPGFAGDSWTMFYSAWQGVPPGSRVPLHPKSGC